jgi:hypothetical protein|tara:strand:- start:3 stop:326 length:324 start_codon:yes stop_codon:yes gene_type:complete
MPSINTTNFPYELTNITGGTGNILQFVQNVNNLTGQNFMSGMLLAGFVILFTSMRSAGNKDALIASSFIIAVMAIFFRALEFIDNGRLIIILIIFALIFVISMQVRE